MKQLFWLMSISILAVLVIWQIVANSISAETKLYQASQAKWITMC